MTDHKFTHTTEAKQHNTWRKVRALRQHAVSAGDYQRADFWESIEKLITGTHTNKTLKKLSAVTITQ